MAPLTVKAILLVLTSFVHAELVWFYNVMSLIVYRATCVMVDVLLRSQSIKYRCTVLIEGIIYDYMSVIWLGEHAVVDKKGLWSLILVIGRWSKSID